MDSPNFTTGLTVDRVRELFYYDQDAGGLCRLGSHVKKRSARADGYIAIKVDQKKYYEHRLVWFWHYGEWPSDYIDHIDRNRSNNKIENLRQVTASENQQNKLAFGSTGIKGVRKASKKTWEAKIGHMWKVVYLGRFKSPEEAYEAYCLAAAKLHAINPVSIA